MKRVNKLPMVWTPASNRKAAKALSREASANSFEVIAREWFDKQALNGRPVTQIGLSVD